jgi:calcineurin-like phosphoesterase
MPIEIPTKEDIKEAVLEVITPLIEEIEKLKTNDPLDLYSIITREQAAKHLGCTPESLDKLAREGKIGYIIRNGKRKYRKIDVLNYLKNESEITKTG